MTEQNNLKTISIYTDGACSGNPGPGGWAAILEYAGHRKEISGNMPHTTNNRMEVFALISALGELKMPCNIHVYSDSSYLVNAFNNHWLDNWTANNWKTSENKPVENQDLWKLLILLIKKKGHHLMFHKVKGHSDHPENNRCDEMAREEIKIFYKRNPDLGDAESFSMLHAD